MPKSGSEPEVVVIRRYGNRRLYDTQSSCYVNRQDVRALVREGRRIQVLDAKTEEDVTRRVLTQIVLETAEQDEQGLPLDLLYELARASDRAFRDFLDWYLKSSLEVYRNLQERWQADARRRWGEARPALEAWAQLWDPRQVAASLAQLLSPFERRPPLPEPARGRDAEAPAGTAPSEEIDELRRRLDALERRLAAERRDPRTDEPRGS
ncbi:MAG TPA: polyhydroxyalkanoate synthesis regulator DNA-binding domain-containing protein [Thermoanaerobaculia bacterium]|nr:polyhydroxyalkanoate synthesis regulator DNA-binding domain-containing protein [Thermoanaerobaculia bacterium]